MAQRKGERIEPLFTSQADARRIIDGYCVADQDDPLEPTHVELLVARLMPQFWLGPSESDGEGSIGATRFGGAPDLPRGSGWPMRSALPEQATAAGAGPNPNTWIARLLGEEVPFEFVAQIDLEDAARHRPHAKGLPDSGRLLFFMDTAALLHATSATTGACRVLHDRTPRDGLVRLAVPRRFEDMEAWWRTPDPGEDAHFEAMARQLDASGATEAAAALREVAREAPDHASTATKPFVHPSRAMRLVALSVLPGRAALELDFDDQLRALAEDERTEPHYDLLTANDVGPFTADPDDVRVTQPWLTREARRNRLLGPPQPEQDDPRFATIGDAERPPYPWNGGQLAAMCGKAAEWRLLLQVSIADLSQRQTEGTVYFTIRVADLDRADFSRVAICYQQT